MHIFDLFTEEDLQAGLEAKLISIREADDGQRIYNYSNLAMFTPGAWDNPAVMICRGLITDTDGNVVARPYTKFFNSNQPEALISLPDLESPVEVTDKEDGSLAILHYAANGELRVATRGSFQSDQAIAATEWVRTSQAGLAVELPEGFTPLFEWVGPDNRIVLSYDENELILLGGVDISSGAYYGPIETAKRINWTGKQAKTFTYKTLQEALDAEDRDSAEGFCVRFTDRPHVVKVKQADYVALHKIVTGLSERSVWEHMLSGRGLSALLIDLPDELHEWTMKVWFNLTFQVKAIKNNALREYTGIVLSMPETYGRKEFAQLAVKSEYRSYMFLMYDNVDITTAILKNLRPEGSNKAKVITEETA